MARERPRGPSSRLKGVVEGAGGTPELRDEWRRLAEGCGNAFVTPEWGDAWATHYGEGADRVLVTVRDPDGTLAGVLPLALSGRTLRFAGANVGDLFNPVCAPGREAEVAAAAAAALTLGGPAWRTFVVDNTEAGAPWIEAFRAAWPSRLATAPMRSNTLPFIDLAGHTWDSWKAARSRNFRSQIGRRTRSLERDHGARFRRTEDPDRVATDMDTFFRLHDARWGDRSTSSSERVRAFHATLARSALECGWLRLWFLEADGREVAAWYGWRVGDTYSYYLAGFDPDWSAEGVGFVLLAHTVRAALDEGATTYDLLLGDEDYKARFATGERAVETLLVMPRLHPARLLTPAESQARRLVAALPESARQRAHRGARALKTRLPSNRSR